MKKIILLTSMIFITGIAKAQPEHHAYASLKMGIGSTTIYIDKDTKFGDYLVAISGNNSYDPSGLLLEFSPAMGVDVTMNSQGWFHLRVEAEMGYDLYSENGDIKDNYTVTNKIKVKLNQFFWLMNGYADFKIGNIIPYVGFGAGYSFGKNKTTINDESESVNDNGIIYALYAGIGYRFSDITTFDFGYRRVNAPAEYDGSYIFNSIRLGARFRI